MKERLFIILSLALIVIALVGLNAASYAPVTKEPDTEEHANRSTYNGGATGTRAFFDFLRETGKPVVRWQERTTNLLDKTRTQQPKTFVLLDNTRYQRDPFGPGGTEKELREFEEQEVKDLLTWVAAGNRLVIIDRNLDAKFLPKSGNWQVKLAENSATDLKGDSSNVNEMTREVIAARPLQPNVLTAGVNSVMPSKFAVSINLLHSPQSDDISDSSDLGQGAKTNNKTKIEVPDNKDEEDDDAPPAPKPVAPKITSKSAPISVSYPFLTPVVDLTSKDKNILVDYVYGAGRIIILSDSYIVSNGGIGLVDNLKLATNLVGSDGVIAFDEYHQGFGASGNPLLKFFEGTPLPAIFAQLALLLALGIYTKGRRFARPLPLPNPDRRSKLEYVGAMAELQRRTRAYDLAIENIYGRVRRNLARFAGVDNISTPPHILAERVAERSRLDKNDLTNLLRDCEDVIYGEPIGDKQALALAAKLRETEKKLGLRQTNLKSKS
ncbi:MAG: DUF4350 domain-containing protein [Pyrinomonadaceae bacterium]